MAMSGLILSVLTALRVAGPLSPRIASYEIRAALDPSQHRIHARERIHWKNSCGTPDKLIFHLYMNAFRNLDADFFRESKSKASEFPRIKGGWGSIDVTRWKVDGVDVTAHADVQGTLAEVTLSAPVTEDAIVNIDLEFDVVLPRIFARAGYEDNYFAVGQWFPKIAVQDCAAEDGAQLKAKRPYRGWRAHQYHRNSEFFSDYGNYDVEISVPPEYRMGATGVLVSRVEKAGRAIFRYYAEDVHDFAWVAYPHFQVLQDKLTDEWGEIAVIVLGIPGRERLSARHLRAAVATLKELERRYGPYPYSQLTVVDTAPGAENASGMEYPTLVFTYSPPVPRGIRIPELTTIHEIGHQYFYGLIGSDEVEEPWLDEGVNEAATSWLAEKFYIRDAEIHDFLGHHLSTADLARAAYQSVADWDPLSTPAFAFLSPRSYAGISYTKTDLMLHTLENYAGAQRIQRTLHDYVDQWKFRHPRGADLEAALANTLDATWQTKLHDLIHTTKTFDYEIRSVESYERDVERGLPPLRQESPAGKYISEVVVFRKGELTAPVDVEFRFGNGEIRREHWNDDNDQRWQKYTFHTDAKLLSATVDPSEKLTLDRNRWNNSLSVEADSLPAVRLVEFWRNFIGVVWSLLGA